MGVVLLGVSTSFAQVELQRNELAQQHADRLNALTAAQNPVALENERKHAAAVSAAAAAAPKASFADSMFNSSSFATEVQRQQSSNQVAQAAATPGFIDKIRSALPRIGDTGNQLKYGRHVTISADGDEAIELIRSAALATTQPERNQSLKRLKQLSSARCPEALNILGFLLETGSFGVQRDAAKAKQYYQGAADVGYQPALYNLALTVAYGRGAAPDAKRALSMLDKANSLGTESSYRVCGMASFLAFRQGLGSQAGAYSDHCASPLTHLYKSTSDTKIETLNKRVDLLRDFLGTGSDDAYPLLIAITKPHIKNDPGQLYCKYLLLSRYRAKTDFQEIKRDADHCVSDFASPSNSQTVNEMARAQLVAGVAGFVPVELAHIKSLRQSNQFHYSWPVPYLPFAQQEVDLFEPIVGSNKL